MQIQCSQCSARYVVPDQAVGGKGRTVRCAKCQHSWFVAPPAGAAEAPAPEAPSPAAAKPIPRGSNLPVIKYPGVPAGFKAATFGAMAAAAALLILALWPQAYGYPRSHGLALAEVNMFSRFDEKNVVENRPVYEITGKILNTADHTLEVPILRITLADKEGTPLQYWDFSEKGRMLEAGKNIPFTTGQLDVKFSQPTYFIVELGNSMELSLRGKPQL